MVERTDVQGLQRVQSIGRSARQVDTTSNAAVGRVDNSWVGALAGIAKGGMGMIQKHAEEKADSDALIQRQRALHGLNPTGNATRKGLQAHMLVGLQNTLVTNTKQMQEDASRFEGTDAEWDEHVLDNTASVRDAIRKQYPSVTDDRNFDTAITNAQLEQMPSIAGARVSSKIQQERDARYTTYTDNLITNIDELTPESAQAWTDNMQSRAVDLQLTTDETQKGIASTAMKLAQSGDGRLIEATKHIKDDAGVSLYERDPALKQAAVHAKRIEAQGRQGQIAETKDLLETQYIAGDISKEDFYKQADSLNVDTGNAAYSEEQLRSVDRKKATVIATAAKNRDINSLISNIATGNAATVATSHLDNIPMKTKQDALTSQLSQVATQVDQQVQDGLIDPMQSDQAKLQAMTNERLKWAKVGVFDKVMEGRINQFKNTDFNMLVNNKEETPYMNDVLNTYNLVPDSQRESVFGLDNAAFMNHYSTFRNDGDTPAQALQQAQNAKRNVTYEKKEITKAVSSIVGDMNANDGWGWSSNFTDRQSQQVSSEADDLYRTYRRAGFTQEDARERSLNHMNQNWKKVGNTIIKSPNSLSKIANVAQVNPDDLDMQLNGFMESHKADIMEHIQGAYDFQDVYPDIDADNGTFILRAGSTKAPIGKRMRLSELSNEEYATAYQNKPVKVQSGNSEYAAVINLSNEFKLLGKASTPSANVIDSDSEPMIMDESKLPSNATKEFVDGEVVYNIPIKSSAGQVKRNNEWMTQMKGHENLNKEGRNSSGMWTPFDSDLKRDGKETIGYGHMLTDEERKNGYILVVDNPIRFQGSDSEFTDTIADALFEQDLTDAREKLSSHLGRDADDIPEDASRALIDGFYNGGNAYINNNPKAVKYMRKGEWGAAFITSGDYINEGGKRSGGLAKRTAARYNLLDGVPKVEAVSFSPEGEVKWKFSKGSDYSGLPKEIRNKIKGDVIQITRPKRGSRHPWSKPYDFTPM